MKVGDLVSFHSENFFEGAVQLRWVDERPAQAEKAAEAFVFHGPRYHAASDAESDGIEGGYRLKDSVSFVRDLLGSIHSGLCGEEVNPYWLVVAGYGSGKSHLALTSATLLGNPQGAIANKIVTNISQADADISKIIQADVAKLLKPVLVLTLDGMAGFHLGNALSHAVMTQLRRYGVDAGAIRALSPRFQTAEQFVERNFAFRAESFASHLSGLSAEDICTRLRVNDETIYNEVDALYIEANGTPIPVVGQESAQELINTLCDVYCAEDGAFSSVVIMFDEFGRYLEYAAEKPLLAGDAALQQIFQGVQDNSSKVRFIGFIQYELKAYLKRFGSSDLRQLQRYITRFDSAQKWYLSTNLETIFAHMIGKELSKITQVWQESGADKVCHESWQRMSGALPNYNRFPVWSDAERFKRVIAQGCWPLHPLATWFLTRQRDVVQSRSALTFIKEMIERISSEAVLKNGRLRQVSAAELILSSMLPEMIAAERESGSAVAETLQLLLEKFSTHLSQEQRQVLAGVAILEKMRVGKQNQNNMDYLLCEATALTSEALSSALKALSQDLGAIEWNRDLGQYELIADASTRGQFQQWLRKQQSNITVDAIRDLFVRRGATDTELGNISTDFALRKDISTQEWQFEAQFAHSHILEKIIQRVFQDWEQATTPTDAKGKVIYVYIHSDEDIIQLDAKINTAVAAELKRLNYNTAPIWVIGISDQDGVLADHMGRLHLFDEKMSPEDRERFRRFVPEEIERSRQALKEGSQESIKRRLFWVAGLQCPPEGRLKQVGDAIFSKVYPHAIPFPFDGFATSAGGGAADCAQLTRSLVARQVDGNWVQAQPKRLQNRVSSLLFRSWKVLSSNGKLTEPVEHNVKAVFESLQKAHQDDPKLTLYKSFKALIAPPYGMNAASAGLMLGLLLGGISPPRRIERKGEMIASTDWVNEAFPAQKGRHFLEKSILEQSTLRFLSEDSEGRWRSLLDRWELEKNYQIICDIAKEALQTKKVDPLPEVLEGKFFYLRDNAEKISLLLKDAEDELEQVERNVERAERQNAVGELLKAGTQLLKKRRTMEDEGCWPEPLIHNGDVLVSLILQMLSGVLDDWIKRQSCNSSAQVGQFRYQMERNVESLKLLGFKSEAQILEGQAQRSIAQVEAKQKFSLTLDESEDYPRQSGPTESTPVRDLRDAITKGDELIKGVQSANSVLNSEEISARIRAIETRQNRLREMLKRQSNILGDLFSLTLENEVAIRDTLVKADRLRKIFVGTPDESEVGGIVTLLERILNDVAVWESNNLSPERLNELLKQQIERQINNLNDFLDSNEIESTWDIRAIYTSLAKERVDAVLKCSTDWLAPRAQLSEQIDLLDLNRCVTLEKELIAAPDYLSDDGRAKVECYLAAVQLRHAKLGEELRCLKIKDWQKQFFSLENIQKLSQYEAEKLLKALNNPPAELTFVEQQLLKPIESQVTLHLDQISIDEIISRIQRLPLVAQRQLIAILTEKLEMVLKSE
jgi:hypothetical protein